MITIDLMDVLYFVLIFAAVAGTWGFGYWYGLNQGYEFAIDESVEDYPLLNVGAHAIDDSTFTFYEMVSGKTIVVGTFEDCANELASMDNTKQVIFSIVTDESVENDDTEVKDDAV